MIVSDDIYLIKSDQFLLNRGKFEVGSLKINRDLLSKTIFSYLLNIVYWKSLLYTALRIQKQLDLKSSNVHTFMIIIALNM